jgi:hypothetical protein
VLEVREVECWRLEAGLEDGLESSCWIEGRIKSKAGYWIKA